MPCGFRPVRSETIDLSSPSLGAIRRTSAVDTVRARIWLAVHLGMLSPGQKLPPPTETAQAFNVGEMTVRRAYRALVDEGLVIRHRGHSGGTFIAESLPAMGGADVAAYQADVEHVHGLIDQRATLEAGLATLASSRRSEHNLAAMAGLVDRMKVVSDWAEYRDADTKFHAELASASGVAAAAALHHRISHELYSYFIPYRMDYLRASNDEHAALVDALTTQDAAQSGRLAFDHVARLHQSMYIGLTSM